MSPMLITRAALVASVVSGAPSTAHALLIGRDPLAAAQAAGAMRVLVGMAAGAAIAVLDLGVIGRRIAPIRALPQAPQVADHLAFGAAAAALLGSARA